jgi:hypothetical protein
MNAEELRLENRRRGKEDWNLWGPYLSERAWGTVREDYSPDGEAWDHFSHEQSRSRAYRWSEDGIAGFCDEKQRLCLAFTFWNGRDPILKERFYGLTGNEGNRGEDVKELFFYTEGLPSHSRCALQYKYPQAEFPYERLKEENARRSRNDPPFQLLDTGIFDEGRYFDIEVVYAKASTDRMAVRLTAVNRGPKPATLHVLPTLWFRNDWSWNDEGEKPFLRETKARNAAWAVYAEHHELGAYSLFGRNTADLLFTENESNKELLFGTANESPYVKDAFHRSLVNGEAAVVNPEKKGTKCTAVHMLELAPGEEQHIDLVLMKGDAAEPFGDFEEVLETRKAEADVYFEEHLPGVAETNPEDALIFRQALAGMIWCKQFYHYDVRQWLEGDEVEPPEERKQGRNKLWRHLKAADVISMPDGWEYPWFAAWDSAFHCIVFSIFDVDFAKEQLELFLESRFIHPNGQIPAYEWAFEDVNPPVHAAAVLEIFRRERRLRGKGDTAFLRRSYNKLIMNYGWWLNRKDAQGLNVFEGGFMGLDNISVYDRSKPLPEGFSLKQADATGWMAMFCLNMTAIAVELAQEDAEYEDMAIQTYVQFLAIADSIYGSELQPHSLWDESCEFFMDLVTLPGGGSKHIHVYSYVGLIPLFAGEITIPEQLKNVPRFKAMLDRHGGGVYDGHVVSACPVHANENGEHFLSLVDEDKLRPILSRLLDEKQFLSDYGVRGMSKHHADHKEIGIPGMGTGFIQYEPGESTSPLFGGNSNWRGPVWMPINYMLMRALSKFQRYLGDDFKVPLPHEEGREVTLGEAVDMIAMRLLSIFKRNENGLVPAFPEDSPFQHDPHWKDLRLFHEYFNGETGLGLGASHQTGWTGLTANIIQRKHLNKLKKT